MGRDPDTYLEEDVKQNKTKPNKSGIHTDVTQTRGQSQEADLEGRVSHVKHKNPNNIGHAPRKTDTDVTQTRGQSHEADL